MSSPDSTDADAPPATEPSGDPDERAALRVLGLLVGGVVAAIVAVALVLTGSRGDAGSPLVDRTDGRPSVQQGGAPGAPTAAIGPTSGEPVDGYIEDRQAVLRAVEGRYVAVVSLTEYETVDDADALARDLEVLSHLVALVGDEQRQTDDVARTREEVVEDAEPQLEEIEGLVPTVDDLEFAEFYESEIERYRRLLDAADRDDVVFGLVVVGQASDLRALASRTSVRLVDVGASRDLAADASLTGIRPEETELVGEPPFRP